MEQLVKKCIHGIFLLRILLKKYAGDFVPYELINLIILLSYPKVKLSCGPDFTFLIVDNLIYSWGSNGNYQLQLDLGEKMRNFNKPKKMNMENIDMISCGMDNSILLTTSGNVIRTCRYYDSIILSNIIKISSKKHHYMALSKDNKIYSWGTNEHGQLGIGNLYNTYTPQLVNLDFCNGSKIVDISSGYHSSAIMTDTDVYIFGIDHFNNKWRQKLPHKINLFDIKLIDYCWASTLIITKNNEFYVLGSNIYEDSWSDKEEYKLEKINLENVNKISCGARHVIARTNNNEIYALGNNRNNQCGLNDAMYDVPQKLDLKNILTFGCNNYGTVFVNIYGEVYTMGLNRSGELGLGHNDISMGMHKVSFDNVY